MVRGTSRGGEGYPQRWSSPPPQVVNRTPTGGQPDPQRWSIGPPEVVKGTSRGGHHHPKGFGSPPPKVRLTTLSPHTQHPPFAMFDPTLPERSHPVGCRADAPATPPDKTLDGHMPTLTAAQMDAVRTRPPRQPLPSPGQRQPPRRPRANAEESPSPFPPKHTAQTPHNRPFRALKLSRKAKDIDMQTRPIDCTTLPNLQ